jgi:hypothetical protein
MEQNSYTDVVVAGRFLVKRSRKRNRTTGEFTFEFDVTLQPQSADGSDLGFDKDKEPLQCDIELEIFINGEKAEVKRIPGPGPYEHKWRPEKEWTKITVSGRIFGPGENEITDVPPYEINKAGEYIVE